MQDLENKIRAALADQFGLSDEWQDGTYLYHLTRVKEAFGLGTMSFDDFEEVDEDFLEEAVQTVMDVVATQVKELEDWKELFYLLKRDHSLQENFQTNNWMVKAREMGIDI